MKLSEIKKHLHNAESVNFRLPNGTFVPEHFHITEVGVIAKDFIDCGGTVRHEKVANFQLWNANDFEHRLKAKKLLDIISLSEKVLALEDLEIEVEYQTETIGKYDLGFEAGNFVLMPKQAACLAVDKCGVPAQKTKIAMVELASSDKNCCTPGGGCC
jgi:Family of unknown function (DUF6428)